LSKPFFINLLNVREKSNDTSREHKTIPQRPVLGTILFLSHLVFRVLHILLSLALWLRERSTIMKTETYLWELGTIALAIVVCLIMSAIT